MMTIKNTRGTRTTRVEAVDNWHKDWLSILALVDARGHRECLLVDDDGWLSARQVLLASFESHGPAGYLCLQVQPVELNNHRLFAVRGRVVMEATVQVIGVRDDHVGEGIERRLLEAAIDRARSLQCRQIRCAAHLVSQLDHASMLDLGFAISAAVPEVGIDTPVDTITFVRPL